MTEEKNGDISGILDFEETPTIVFDSEERKVEGDKVFAAEIEVGGFTVASKRNLQEQTLVAGAGGDHITRNEKKSLTALCKKLEDRYGVLGTPLPQEEDLLLRSTCYYAEAPVGYPLKNITLHGPSTVYIQEQPERSLEQEDTVFVKASYGFDPSERVSDSPTNEECDQAQTLHRTGELDDFSLYVACQQNGNNGVTELTSCRPYSINFYWDSVSSPRLCYGYRGNRAAGPCTTYCKGRCGKGCGNSKQGFYTRDCAEHDDCVGYADGSGSLGNDSNCGDEYDEAVGDFLQRYKRTCSNCN